MTAVQHATRVFGWVFVVVAIWGALVTGTSMEADPAAAPRLWGLFPVNLAHNFVHLLFGIWGLSAARSVAGSKIFTAVGGAVYLLLAVIGVFAPRLFGIMPVGGNDVWLHAALGIGLLLAGVILAGPPTPDPVVQPPKIRTVRPPGPGASTEGSVARPADETPARDRPGEEPPRDAR
jgi:hypothetical protein